MSTNLSEVGTLLLVLYSSASRSSRSSGTGTTPTFGSTVQNGKFAASALADESELKRVLLPTLGNPTMPHENPMVLRRARQHGTGAKRHAILRRASRAGCVRRAAL